MNKIKLIVITVSILFGNLCVCQNIDNSLTSLNEEINTYITEIITRHEIPGAAVGVIQNGKVIFENYYGLSSIEYNVPVSEKTLFKIHSISKIFVVTGIFQLIEKNKMSLGDNLAKFFDDLPKEWNNIKVKHLLTHSSGLPDIAQYYMLPEQQAKDNIFEGEIEFTPEEKYSYNQTNFWLLNKIIEKVSNEKFENFIIENQFNTHEDNVLFCNFLDIVPNVAREYLPNADGDLKVNDFLPPSYLYGAGGLGLTLNEFIKWNDDLDKNILLSDKSKSQMWSQFEYKADDKLYGIGWEIYPVKESVSYGFAGGYVTHYIKYPDSNIAIIWLSSGYKFSYETKGIVDYIAGLADNRLFNDRLKVGELVCAPFYKGDIKLAISNYEKIKKEYPTIAYHTVLNKLGYSLLKRKSIKDAIEVFQLNLKENPKSANYYDSLGEGYFVAGEYELSKQNYLKVIELDSGNSNAKMMIEKINNLGQEKH